jgi:STAS-like domain of unknown function (DUF4325)
MTTRIRLAAGVAGFAEDKDYARTLRQEKILPALDRGGRVVLQFEQVRYATQSFVHALIGEALKKHGEAVLDRIEFKNCTPQLQSVIELVVDYSLGGFPEHPAQKAS